MSSHHLKKRSQIFLGHSGNAAALCPLVLVDVLVLVKGILEFSLKLKMMCCCFCIVVFVLLFSCYCFCCCFHVVDSGSSSALVDGIRSFRAKWVEWVNGISSHMLAHVRIHACHSHMFIHAHVHVYACMHVKEVELKVCKISMSPFFFSFFF